MSNSLSRLRPLFALALLALPTAACGGGGDDPPTGPDQTPTEMVAASPTTQTATVATAVAQAPAVTVRNAAGQGVAGVTVTFTVTAGGGSIGSATAQTNASGTASAGSWTLGATAGANTVSATAGTLTPVVFNATGQAVVTNPPPPSSFLASQIEVANLAACALRQGSGLVCWGTNPQGQLGDGTTTNRPDPAAVAAPGVTFTQVAMGSAHSCGLASTGVVYCWGSNNGGRIGDGTTTDRLTPTNVAGGRTYKAVAVGSTHSCAIGSDDRGWCWGLNSNGALGVSGVLSASQPTAVSGGDRSWRAIAAGGAHSCAVTTANVVYCWGSNTDGQLGDNSTAASTEPVQLALPGFTASAITAGANFSCALRASDGVAFCWGDNQFGQLGDGSTTDRLTPVNVTGALTFRQIDAGDTYACGVTTGNALYCWGQNDLGQLGIGSATNASAPQLVAPPAGQTWKSVSAAIGGKRVCATTSTDAAYCWGTNTGGLISGDATVSTPSAVRGS